LQVERDLEEIELILWGAPERAPSPPGAPEPRDFSGAAAAMAFVAFLSFATGLGLALLLLL